MSESLSRKEPDGDGHCFFWRCWTDCQSGDIAGGGSPVFQSVRFGDGIAKVVQEEDKSSKAQSMAVRPFLEAYWAKGKPHMYAKPCSFKSANRGLICLSFCRVSQDKSG